MNFKPQWKKKVTESYQVLKSAGSLNLAGAMIRLIRHESWIYGTSGRNRDTLNSGIYLMRDVKEEHIGDIKPSSDGRLTSTERQWLQVSKAVNGDINPYVNIEGLKQELDSFTYPLHFIDFETSMVAIPFFQGKTL